MATLAFLSVEIKGTSYGVEQFEACGGNRVVRLSKADGTTYDVEEGAERTTCDCPDFQRRHACLPHSEGCKHVRAMVELGLVVNVKPWVVDEADMPAECGVSGEWFPAGEIAAQSAAMAACDAGWAAGLAWAQEELQDDAIYAECGHVEAAQPRPAKRGRPTVANHLDWAAIGKRYADGESYRALAAEVGVKPSTLYTKVRGLGFRPLATTTAN